MTKLLRIDKFTNDDKVPTIPRNATYRYINEFNEDDTINVTILWSESGWNIETEKTSIMYYEGDDIPSYEPKEATEDFNEGDRERVPKGSPDAGQWTGDTSKIESYKPTLEQNIVPTEKIQRIQEKADTDITKRIKEVIKKNGWEDKVDTIAMQGSYEKGTDLPSKGSDLDLFMMFNPDIPEKERNDMGLAIGLEVMTPEFAESQGWTDFRVDTKDATSKYAEAYFTVDGQEMEVQIVPTRTLSLDEIKNKEHNGEKISIGMERTPHQTEFMNNNLTGTEKKETRVLKKFMKETRLYDSSMKSQGFSGYSTEVLIHNFGSFERAMDYFANNFKVGDVVGLPEDSKYTKDTYQDKKIKPDNADWKPFHMIDPIDPNRDLIKAFSTKKIARTILTARSLSETGLPPNKSEDVEMDSVSIDIKSKENNPDTLSGQVQSFQRDVIDKMASIGFNVEKEFANPMEIVEGFSINPERTSIEERKGGELTLNFGMNKTTLGEDEMTQPKINQGWGRIPDAKKEGILAGMKNPYTISEDGSTLTQHIPLKYSNAQEALNGFLSGETINGVTLSTNSPLVQEIITNYKVHQKNSVFENLI